MKKLLLISSLALAVTAKAQFSSGTVNLSAASMTVKLDTNASTATITLIGDSNSMMGIGFGTSGMASGADGFIYNSSSNRDYTFAGFTAPTADAVQNWNETSNTVSGSTRTVVATRSLTGGAGDFTIANAAGTINIFYARTPGSTNLGYHSGNRGYASLNMAGTLGTNDLVAESKKVVIYPNPAKETVNFRNADLIESVDFFDATGRKVKSVKLDEQTVDISSLKNGVYYLEVNLKNKKQSVERLVKE
ncbi:T9SS type A sorting domain-containing protein [Chryseobacterium balustinum]|uniref:Por secretion system C-terminal sorting domain n=1 Tax=Chryseobacterium balustinum TaxID=246 RepID=A0AAX2ISC9_9FLAO|nr:T9SS type A sorting domain-containing protein [Chryseobacterium balustinum]AZB28375.1 T9SS C-terminal target domain-containing protein [Chryseobacterium balustinum]SKC04577.1 Por secretion system C-terminal sorting domain-containing protein [Chryseobacterium balustinum]SQA92687.1 Por secretion system C-terminal sorting domain [Chryseobacterium balustinum]